MPSHEPPSLRRPPPLCVDLDGTLIASDTLADSFCLMVRQAPLTMFLAPFWLLRGWPRLKDEMVARTLLPVANLPYRREVLHHVRCEREKGREIVLVTATARRIAEEVAAETQLFDAVIASAHGEGLRGERKAQRLVERFGAGGFDYIGDCMADLAVWAKARKAVVVGGERLRGRVRKVAQVEAIFDIPRAGASAWLNAMGAAAWPWLLLLLPAALLLVTDEGTGTLATLSIAALFCLASAAFGLLDGLLAVVSDRDDPQRRHRPFASGRLPVLPGVLLAAALLLTTGGLALFLPSPWGLAFAGFVVLGATLLFLPTRQAGLTSAGPREKVSPLPPP